MTSTAPISPRSARAGRDIASGDTLRRKALEKLTLAIARAVEAASDNTLADIVGSEDLRHALAIAPRDIAPEFLRISKLSGSPASARLGSVKTWRSARAECTVAIMSRRCWG